MHLIGPKEISGVLSITDELGIHREAVRVPLDPAPGGRIAIEGGKVLIVFPSDDDPQIFLSELPDALAALPGIEGLKKADEAGLDLL